MKICRVEGSVHGTISDPSLTGHKILITQPINRSGRPEGEAFLALDRVDAGPGDLVIVMKEGGSARLILGDDKNPVQALVVAVVDDLNLED